MLKLEKNQRVYQVTQTLNLTDLDGVGLRVHKDQVGGALVVSVVSIKLLQ